LYKWKCDLSGKNIISMFSGDKKYKVYHQNEWYSDKWDPMDYGQKIDWKKPFFEQFWKLLENVPKMALVNVNTENSKYANFIADAKNCYMTYINYFGCENIYYSQWIISSSFCSDSYRLLNCERYIGCTDWMKLNTCYYLHSSTNSSFCYFSVFLENCSDCIFCNNLVWKKYYIANKEYSKEEYLAYLEKLKSNSAFFEKWFQKFEQIMKSSIYPAMNIVNSENSIGNDINNSKNIFHCFSFSESENSRYSRGERNKNVCDLSGGGMEMGLECINVGLEGTSFLIWCVSVINSHHMYYCDNCYEGCEYCFECVGLRWKKYCIFNKQYSKDEREAQVSKLIEKMIIEWVWWHFFPKELSPFAYNESWASENYPLSKDEILSRWFVRKDEQISILDNDGYSPLKITEYDENIVWKQVADENKKILLASVLKCQKSDKAFRVIKQELDLYKKMWVSIPRLHPDERYNELCQRRAGETMFLVNCSKCNKETLSVYSKDSGLEIYCEDCYREKMFG